MTSRGPFGQRSPRAHAIAGDTLEITVPFAGFGFRRAALVTPKNAPPSTYRAPAWAVGEPPGAVAVELTTG